MYIMSFLKAWVLSEIEYFSCDHIQFSTSIPKKLILIKAFLEKLVSNATRSNH